MRNVNPNRVSMLEKMRMHSLLKKLSLTQLYVLRDLANERITKLERKILK